MRRWIGSYGFITGDDGQDYFFCKSNIVPEQREMRLRNDQPFRFTVSKEPDPDAEEGTTERNGRAAKVIALE